MPPRYVLALDQGTTSSRAILFDRAGTIVAQAQQEFPQILPSPGVVEHDPEAIWSSQLATARRCLELAEVTPTEVAAIGITNQRETTILWDRATGRAVAPAIVWQSRISAPECERLKQAGLEPLFRERTGLVVDAYFSGTKVQNLLDTMPGLRSRAERGEIAFGTVDSWLIWRLTNGRVHATDYSNASRTLMFNIHTLAWDDDLLAVLDVPRALLPDVRPSGGAFGVVDADWLGCEIPISGCCGDQQGAMFGQNCFTPGMAKNTYGTGCFLLLNTGAKPVVSRNQLLTTIGWGLDGKVTYCLEGSVFVGGAVVQWLRDELGLVHTAAEIEPLAAQVSDSDGVVFVPAFVGLGAPYWNPYARGAIFGLTRGTRPAHLARAALEALVWQTRDLIEAMERDSGARRSTLRVDGGAATNNLLMQLQADALGTPVERPTVYETTALGAAYLAGLAVGFWADLNDVIRNWQLDRRFEPGWSGSERDARYAEWQRAVRATIAAAPPSKQA